MAVSRLACLSVADREVFPTLPRPIAWNGEELRNAAAVEAGATVVSGGTCPPAKWLGNSIRLFSVRPLVVAVVSNSGKSTGSPAT